jgi:hypothetical protein
MNYPDNTNNNNQQTKMEEKNPVSKPIYNTNLITNNRRLDKIKKFKASQKIKDFEKINKESDNIMNNLKPTYFITSEPINPLTLTMWLVVILIIIFLIIEYINKTSNNTFDSDYLSNNYISNNDIMMGGIGNSGEPILGGGFLMKNNYNLTNFTNN